MKFLVLFTVLLMPCVSMAFQMNPFSNSYDNLGNVNHYDKAFVTVKTPLNVALTDGQVVVLDTTSDDGIVVATSVSPVRAAHCVVDEAIVANRVGRCQIFGHKSNVKFDAGVAATAGQGAFISASNAGYASGAATSSIADYGMKPFGIFLDTSIASGTIEMFIKAF